MPTEPARAYALLDSTAARNAGPGARAEGYALMLAERHDERDDQERHGEDR